MRTTNLLILVVLGALIIEDIRPQAKAPDTDSLKASVDHFFKAWLVNRNVDEAIESFDSIGLSNPGIFSEDCIGGSKDRGERADEKRIRNFLQEFQPKRRPKGVRELLVLDHEVIETSGARLINSPAADGYYLLSGDRSQSLEGEEGKYLKGRIDLSQAVVCMAGIQFDQEALGWIYTIWYKRGDSWKIVDGGLFCM
jgi:hypothetical protein